MEYVLHHSLTKTLQARLRHLDASGALATLADCKRGIEKESLRVTPAGALSQHPHHRALGSALTHPHITTDYSEALLELITPALHRTEDALSFMHTTHAFVHRNIGDEQLWACSMPCLTENGDNIPVADYGSSNVARMKRIYRIGLEHRYGGLMQAISGVHYNFSLPDAFWEAWPAAERHADATGTTGATTPGDRSAHYFDAVRNVHRYCWLMLYLYGASPALCACFLDGRKHGLESFDDATLYAPAGTCIRMSDLGYHNNAQSTIAIDCNDLAGYTRSLVAATETPWPPYREIGVGKNGEYRQLNANLLQIENEYYSVIRPKQVADSGEKPSRALRERGVAYIEARFIDLNPFAPAGLALEDAKFVEAFLLFCLLAESPRTDAADHRDFAENRNRVIYRGREPGLPLLRDGADTGFRAWAGELLDGVEMTAAALDNAYGNDNYTAAVATQRQRVADPALTLSMRILKDMRHHNESFFAFAMRKTAEHRKFFKSMTLGENELQRLTKLAGESHDKQHEIEQADVIDFDRYLKQYFNE